MIRSMLLMATEVATRCGMPLHRVSAAMGIGHTNVRRWLTRLKNGEQMVNKRGPQVFTSEDMGEAIRSDVRGLRHGNRRSYGTSTIRGRYRGSISRRNLDALVKQARREVVAVTRKNNKRVQWRAANLVWAVDDTELPKDAEHGKITLHQVRDLASRYVFPPMESRNVPEGVAVAQNLDRLFSRHGAPLILKRDNAGNFNNPHVDAVLVKYGVIPLNSPPAYPKYNGAEERGQGELKTEMAIQLEKVNGWSLDTTAPFAHAAANELNHMPRQCLKGAHACHIYATTSISFPLRERKVIYDWIMSRRDSILENAEGKISPETAWRAAVVQWLTKSGLITITAAQKVLPNSTAKSGHQ